MELRNIRLTNFRQFYGTQSLDLSTDPERNLTLIRDQNGRRCPEVR